MIPRAIKLALAGSMLAVLQGCFDTMGDYESDGDEQTIVFHDQAVGKKILDSNGLSLPYNGVEPDGEVVAKKFNLYNLGLKSFYFPDAVKDFKNVTILQLSNNELSELPKGIEKGNWHGIWLTGNKICNPSQETIAYLDELVDGYKRGQDWRETQVCN